MSHPIALPACQLLGPTFPYHYISAVCSRRPAACGFASESHLRSPAKSRGCRSPDQRNTRLVARISSVDAEFCTRPANTVDLLANPRATGRFEARDAVLTERRRRCLHPAPIKIAVFRCCFCVWSVHASLGLCRSLLPLALDLETSSDVVGARHQDGIGRGSIWACCVRRKFSPNSAYSDGKRASGCSHRTSQHRAAAASLSATAGACKAACSLCHAYWMHASRRQQQACVWNAASGGMCVRYHGNCAI